MAEVRRQSDVLHQLKLRRATLSWRESRRGRLRAATAKRSRNITNEMRRQFRLPPAEAVLFPNEGCWNSHQINIKNPPMKFAGLQLDNQLAIAMSVGAETPQRAHLLSGRERRQHEKPTTAAAFHPAPPRSKAR